MTEIQQVFQIWRTIPAAYKGGYNGSERFMSVSDRATWRRLLRELPQGWTVGYIKEKTR